jgi:predicted secreted acid phosphatase
MEDLFFFIIILFILFIFAIFINKIKDKENKESKEGMRNYVPDLKSYKKASTLAKKYIKSIDLPDKAAIMFDIDDTLLYVNEKTDKLIPIKPIIDLLNYCINQDILVLIVTARDSKYRKQTVKDLNDNGIRYSYLYLRESPKDDHEYFKSYVKEQMYKKHNIITVVSIGDQPIDVIGDYSGYGLKLPSKTDPSLYEVMGNTVKKV